MLLCSTFVTAQYIPFVAHMPDRSSWAWTSAEAQNPVHSLLSGPSWQYWQADRQHRTQWRHLTLSQVQLKYYQSTY